MDEIGVPSQKVCSDEHAFNLILLNDKWYLVEPQTFVFKSSLEGDDMLYETDSCFAGAGVEDIMNGSTHLLSEYQESLNGLNGKKFLGFPMAQKSFDYSNHDQNVSVRSITVDVPNKMNFDQILSRVTRILLFIHLVIHM